MKLFIDVMVKRRRKDAGSLSCFLFDTTKQQKHTREMKKKLHLFKNLIKALQNNCKSALNFYKIPDRIIDVVSQADIKVVCK